jgi:hypothetical protein
VLAICVQCSRGSSSRSFGAALGPVARSRLSLNQFSQRHSLVGHRHLHLVQCLATRTSSKDQRWPHSVTTGRAAHATRGHGARPPTPKRGDTAEPALLRLLLGNLEPLPPPDPLDPHPVHRPASLPKERRDPAVALPSILRGERDDVRPQRIFIGTSARHLPLGRPVLAELAANEAFRDVELLPDVIDAGPAAGGAQKFPDAASRRISISSVRSDTTFRSRSFSFSSSFSR